MRIIAADSSSAILNEKFEPVSIVATAAVLVNKPYREPNNCLAEPIFTSAGNSHDVIVHEAELCKNLLERVKAEVVHLDISLGAVPVEQLSPIQFSNMRVSGKAKSHLLKILPKLRKVAGEITQKYGVEVLAIGKESIPVRIAELTAGAHAIIYASNKALTERHPITLGLPSKCQPKIGDNRVYVYSLMAGEHDVRGFAENNGDVFEKVNIVEMLNPFARGFRALKISPK
ncbi:MAG: DUF4152 family protein [Nitrososphaerota archaeon]|nr:DUF4152 family protein [Candidatus Bathyarchaeota archaeon]MDW8023231.1 DUF4152 family protein [Nitrososphaerota archaeon]